MEYRKHGQTVTLTVTLTANHIDSHSDKQRQTFSQSVSHSDRQTVPVGATAFCTAVATSSVSDGGPASP